MVVGEIVRPTGSRETFFWSRLSEGMELYHSCERIKIYNRNVDLRVNVYRLTIEIV